MLIVQPKLPASKTTSGVPVVANTTAIGSTTHVYKAFITGDSEGATVIVEAASLATATQLLIDEYYRLYYVGPVTVGPIYQIA